MYYYFNKKYHFIKTKKVVLLAASASHFPFSSGYSAELLPSPFHPNLALAP